MESDWRSAKSVRRIISVACGNEEKNRSHQATSMGYNCTFFAMRSVDCRRPTIVIIFIMRVRVRWRKSEMNTSRVFECRKWMMNAFFHSTETSICMKMFMKTFKRKYFRKNLNILIFFHGHANCVQRNPCVKNAWCPNSEQSFETIKIAFSCSDAHINLIRWEIAY